jgi:segregation and condensation protein A
VKLSQFEGPLDLLLHLISSAKINIEDIFVSQITEQYIQHMEAIDELDMDRASEFLQMAATLLYIKSRTLVPSREEPEAEETDTEQELIERLKQYKLYKDACEMLKTMESDAKQLFYKLAEELPQLPEKVSFEGITLDALYEAFLKAFNRMKTDEGAQTRPLHIAKEGYSVKEKMGFVLRELRRNEHISFFALIMESKSRLEAAVTFLAVLELLHRNEILLKQQNHFEDIWMYSAKKAGHIG